uniref:Uncharacterized protein MANES_06G125400 n=1 Tax=Rhizophora mucronata TaxID=61149 RepID=A0A2P2K0Q6_RHIMU
MERHEIRKVKDSLIYKLTILVSSSGFSFLLDKFFDQVSSFLDRCYVLRALLFHTNVKFFFQSHDYLHGVKGIGTKCREFGFGGELGLRR